MKKKYITPNMRRTHLNIENIVCGSPITNGNNIAVDDSPADFSDDLAKSIGIRLEYCNEEE